MSPSYIKEIVTGLDPKIVICDDLIYAELRRLVTRKYLENKGAWDLNADGGSVVGGAGSAVILFKGAILQKCDEEDLLYVAYHVEQAFGVGPAQQEIAVAVAIPIPIHTGPVRPLVYPPRALVTTVAALQPLFDLPEDLRPLATYTIPSRNNHPDARTKKWNSDHTVYLADLMHLAVLILNRGLETRDFPAITEALHRRYRPDNISIPYRGYNAVHSFATRNDNYRLLEMWYLA